MNMNMTIITQIFVTLKTQSLKRRESKAKLNLKILTNHQFSPPYLRRIMILRRNFNKKTLIKFQMRLKRKVNWKKLLFQAPNKGTKSL